MTAKWFRRGLLIAFSGLFSLILATHLFGPHAAVVSAFEEFKAHHHNKDVAAEAAMTSPEELRFFEIQRQHALHSSREVVEKLRFRQRMAVLALRAQVRKGLVEQSVLADDDVFAAYNKFHALGHAHFDVVAKMEVLFTIPVSTTKAYGYVSLSGDNPNAGLRRYYAPFLFGARYGFEKIDGKWHVDPTPIAENAAVDNEHVARLIEPSGNRFIFNLLSVPPEQEGTVWMPLAETNPDNLVVGSHSDPGT